MIVFFIEDILPWLLSGITIWMTLLVGNKHKLAWLIGAINQVFWFIWIVGTQTWGMLPMNFALTYVYMRNHFLWKKDLKNSSSLERSTIMTTEKSPFQQRVIEEKDQNDKRLEALGLFITSNPIFQTLDQEEQKRLKRQHELMTELSSVLGERIQNFKD